MSEASRLSHAARPARRHRLLATHCESAMRSPWRPCARACGLARLRCTLPRSASARPLPVRRRIVERGAEQQRRARSAPRTASSTCAPGLMRVRRLRSRPSADGTGKIGLADEQAIGDRRLLHRFGAGRRAGRAPFTPSTSVITAPEPQPRRDRSRRSRACAGSAPGRRGRSSRPARGRTPECRLRRASPVGPPACSTRSPRIVQHRQPLASEHRVLAGRRDQQVIEADLAELVDDDRGAAPCPGPAAGG